MQAQFATAAEMITGADAAETFLHSLLDLYETMTAEEKKQFRQQYHSTKARTAADRSGKTAFFELLDSIDSGTESACSLFTND